MGLGAGDMLCDIILRMKIRIMLLCLLIAGGVGVVMAVRQRPHHDMPTFTDPAAVSIRLERDGCFGTCPIYRVELSGSGDVRYDGERFVLIEGHHGAKVDPAHVAALVEQFRQADFWSLKSQYSGPVTDNPSYRLTLTVNGKSKTVTDYVGAMVGMPAAVTALEKAVDDTAGVARWVKGDAKTLPALRAEHWNFASPQAAMTLARAARDAPDEVAFGLIDAGVPLAFAASSESGHGSRGSEDSALENACLMARLDLARKLIARGAARVPGASEAALFGAVASVHPAMVAEILKLKPAINAPDRDGYTPLMWASAGPHPFFDHPEQTDMKAVIAMLLAAGADPNVKFSTADPYGSGSMSQGATALHLAKDADMARMLISGGARLELRDALGQTPLLATFDEDVALALLGAGADPAARASDGTTLRKRAEEFKWDKVKARLAR